MPAVSPKQYGLMQGILHGSITGGKNMPNKSVARDFIEKTPSTKRKRFASALRGGTKKTGKLPNMSNRPKKLQMDSDEDGF